MPVTYNGKELTKEEFKNLMLKLKERKEKIEKLKQTEIGREILRKKGIE